MSFKKTKNHNLLNRLIVLEQILHSGEYITSKSKLITEMKNIIQDVKTYIIKTKYFQTGGSKQDTSQLDQIKSDMRKVVKYTKNLKNYNDETIKLFLKLINNI